MSPPARDSVTPRNGIVSARCGKPPRCCHVPRRDHAPAEGRTRRVKDPSHCLMLWSRVLAVLGSCRVLALKSMGMCLPFLTSPAREHSDVPPRRTGTDGMHSWGCKSHQQGWGFPVAPFPLHRLLAASQNQCEISAPSTSPHWRCCSHPGQAPAGMHLPHCGFLHPQTHCLGGLPGWWLRMGLWVYGQGTGHSMRWVTHQSSSVPSMPSHRPGVALPVGFCPPMPPCWSCSPGVAAFPPPEPCIPSKAACFTRSTSLTRLSRTPFIPLHPITALCHPS